MKKILLMSVTLSLLLTACSVESDSEKITHNKEQHLAQNTVSELADAAFDLEQIYATVGANNTSLAEIIEVSQDLALSSGFVTAHNLQTSGYVAVTAAEVNDILDLDDSAIQQSSYSEKFKNHVVSILNAQNIQGFKEIVDKDNQMTATEKRILLDAIDFGVISNEHGVDDEWRKRKFMGYILTQNTSSLNVVITATVLNIAMKQ